jgi:hypothetical protein
LLAKQILISLSAPRLPQPIEIWSACSFGLAFRNSTSTSAGLVSIGAAGDLNFSGILMVF